MRRIGAIRTRIARIEWIFWNSDCSDFLDFSDFLIGYVYKVTIGYV